MTVVVYKSTDASAPTLNGTAGSYVTVLDAILVNGYGSKSAAGWAIAYTGTNKRAYRAATGNRYYMRVDDTGAQESRIRGYMTMTDVDTGTDPFPQDIQVNGGCFYRKSNSADSTARPWLCIASSKAFYFFGFTAQTVFGNTSTQDQPMFFGDYETYLTGDAMHTLLIAATATGNNSATFPYITGINLSAGSLNHFAPRAFTQMGGCVGMGKRPRGMYTSGQINSNYPMGTDISSSDPNFPDPVRGGMLMSPMEVIELIAGFNTARGKMPGLWCPQHRLPAAHLDTFSGTGALAGKTFIIVAVYDLTNNRSGRCIVETSDGW